MIISQTPFRISFFGGGTDYPAWYRGRGGSTLVTTIDKYCYITCRYLPPFFEHKHRIVYSTIELAKNIDEIKHPSVRAVLDFMGAPRGLEIHHDADLPARSGLGSSSAFTVGLLKALHAMNDRLISKADLARQALHIEQDVLKEAVGSQDQIAAAYGGFNRVDFNADESFTVTPLVLKKERKAELNRHLMLYFTGFQRNAFEIARKQIDNFANRKDHLKTMHAMVDEAVDLLTSPSAPITQIGKLLDEAWQLKRDLAEGVTNRDIDAIYEAGRDAGAIGGKILGAGGGGFILFFAKPEDQPKIAQRLEKLIRVSFRFEGAGSKVVLHDPDY